MLAAFAGSGMLWRETTAGDSSMTCGLVDQAQEQVVIAFPADALVHAPHGIVERAPDDHRVQMAEAAGAHQILDRDAVEPVAVRPAAGAFQLWRRALPARSALPSGCSPRNAAWLLNTRSGRVSRSASAAAIRGEIAVVGPAIVVVQEAEIVAGGLRRHRN